MKSYYRVMLGAKSIYADECFQGGFIGCNFSIRNDLSAEFGDGMKSFNRRFIPVWMSSHPEKSKISAGLACGALYTVSKGIEVGDLVLSPDGKGRYRIGEIAGEYSYAPDSILPHRRPVRWIQQIIDRSDMTQPLQNSAGSIGTVANLSRYAEEIDQLVEGGSRSVISSDEGTIEDPVSFALEKHLEDFLVANWKQTELGKEYDVFEENGEFVGQQYQTDTGPLDILAVSKDGKRLLVVELKKGRPSDAVVGQVLRYMGFVQEDLAEEGQTVEGIIIALEDDQRIRRALQLVPSVRFFRYEVSFRLVPADIECS
jgi:restriction system protein